MGDAGAGIEPHVAVEASGRTSTAGRRGPGSTRSHAGRWALIGAAWGLLSMLPAIAWHDFAEMLGSFYRLGVWLLPMWWAGRIIEVVEMRFGYVLPSVPVWASVVVYAVSSASLGAGMTLLLWYVAHVVRLGLSKARRT